jgi:hypothetical protein
MEDVQSRRFATLRTVSGMALSCRVISHYSVSCEWSTRHVQHCGCLSTCLACINGVACPHVLQAIIAQVSGILETCGYALETREPSRIGMPTKLFFILKACGPLRVTGHVPAPKPSRAGMTGFGAAGHMAMSKPS